MPGSLSLPWSRVLAGALVVGALVGCGGDDASEAPGAALAPASDVMVVAHQGDDLRLLAGELGDAVARGTGVTTVYVTAGNTEHGVAMVDADADGVKAAYAVLAGADRAAWVCGPVVVADHSVEHCRLAASKLSLIFMGYPDGGHDGAAANSLLHLWESQVRSVAATPSAGAEPVMYDQVSLIATLAAILDASQPTTLRTLEVAATHGDDHSDHMLVGALTVLATAASSVDPALFAHRGDNIAAEPANRDPAVVDRGTQVFGAYAACTTGCAPCGTSCRASQLDAGDTALLARSYPIAIRRSGSGTLGIGADCVTLSSVGTNGTVGDCATAPTWQLDGHGTLRASTGVCLDAILTGEIVGGNCDTGGAGERFFLDAEAHLWAGVVPAASTDMALAHLNCLGNAGGRPRTALCGANRAPTVDLAP